ncbi:protein HEG isoform X1 [Oreochromis aureus]|uniref:EGF-like domain-containing protein n=2 Tax=Oreochromis aureus TaxID=47969 RepID=A0AAZ1XGF0_OREAU|nr:protein HEG isoform X1 [Oreochromis aureus]
METWFLNHVLGLSLLVLHLGLPGPLRAGTPSNNSTNAATPALDDSVATDEVRSMENSATSNSYSSETLTPSQRNLLLRHAAETHAATAGNFGTDQTQSITETSSGSIQTANPLSTEPLTSNFVTATEASSSSISNSDSNSRDWKDSSSSISNSDSNSRDWKDMTYTDKMPGISYVVSEEDRTQVFTEKGHILQDNPDTTLQMGDATASHTDVLTDSTYTTTSRAGERTLLSVTSSSSNSTSSAFTEDSNSRQPPSTWGISPKSTETENYTHSAPSTGITGRDVTDSFKGVFSETGSPGSSSGTQSFTGHPNATQQQHTSTSEEPSDSTSSVRVTEPSTDQSQVSFSSTPPFTSPAGGPTNISGTEQGLGSSSGASTEFSTGDHSSSTQSGTEGLSSQTREGNVDLGLTAVPSTVSSSTSETNQSLTDLPPLGTNVFLTTSPATVTERSQITEENPTISTAFSTTTTTTSTEAITTPPLVPTSSARLTSAMTSSPLQSPTSATVLYSSSSTVASTLAAQPTQRAPPRHTEGPVTGMSDPTNVTTLQIETSTGTHRDTTAHSQSITTTYTHSTPTKSTEALHTTRNQTDRGPTELVVTTLPPDFQHTSPSPPPPPRNPCVPNPCNNEGMCMGDEPDEFRCRCQQGWEGRTCNKDIDECKQKQEPCPKGSTCVNTNGSFSCECLLGFDLEDGRTCSRAKTFLGSLSADESLRNSDIQIIIKLLSVSLSDYPGYRHSTVTKQEKVGIMVVNTFSISANVTTAEVNNRIQMSLKNCSSALAHCQVVLKYKLTYNVESLCAAQNIQCDKERSSCTDTSGIAYCQCQEGYYKHNPDDLSCLECGDGYKLENGTCVPCMFGFGGFNCGNFYKLIAVVVSPAGGALLLILIIALIVTCCKKDKNDINKIIFKSGDLQMSPYADFPKNNRISMEWGRETIEMQENGSTKNLLQMTDIYYSPALRNSDLDRNGLYPFPGLPGSRHSCIYPAQWNPSFISDDSRRRDYF